MQKQKAPIKKVWDVSEEHLCVMVINRQGYILLCALHSHQWEFDLSTNDYNYVQSLEIFNFIPGKISAQPHTIVKQICFPNGNVLFLSLFSLFKNWMHNVVWGCTEILPYPLMIAIRISSIFNLQKANWWHLLCVVDRVGFMTNFTPTSQRHLPWKIMKPNLLVSHQNPYNEYKECAS